MTIVITGCFDTDMSVVDEALQEMRKQYCREALDTENDVIDQARKAKKAFHAEVLSNGDTLKQLLARSRGAW